MKDYARKGKEYKARGDMTSKTSQEKTRQDNTRQGRTRQDRTG